MDTKVSLHATVHIMEPAERHKVIIQKVLEMVRKDKQQAYAAMVEKDALKKGIPNPGALQALGDYAGFMAMDTAMTSNWHQPVQALGSSKGDDVIFKHCAVVCFKAFPFTSIRKVDPDKDYVVHLAKTEEEMFPRSCAWKLAMLIAQHSASIPDTLSITYSASERWNAKYLMAYANPLFSSGANALVALAGGSLVGNKKRKTSSSVLSSMSSTPTTTTCSTPRSWVGGGGGTVTTPLASKVREYVPDWLMRGLTNAVHRYSMGALSFNESNFVQIPSNMDDRGVPEIAQSGNTKNSTISNRNSNSGGDVCLVEFRTRSDMSFSLTHAPCIVSAATQGLLKVHSRNSSFLWVGESEKAGRQEEEGQQLNRTKKKLIYMKCWDPDCQVLVKRQENRASGMFDCYGWARVDRKGVKSVWDI